MTKSTLDNRLLTALAAITAARTVIQSKTETDISNAGTSLEIRVAGGVVIATADGEISYVPDQALTDSVHFSEVKRFQQGYITGSAGTATCPTCNGSGRI